MKDKGANIKEQSKVKDKDIKPNNLSQRSIRMEWSYQVTSKLKLDFRQRSLQTVDHKLSFHNLIICHLTTTLFVLVYGCQQSHGLHATWVRKKGIFLEDGVQGQSLLRDSTSPQLPKLWCLDLI